MSMISKDSDAAIKNFAPINEGEIESFLNKHVILNTNWLNRPIFGHVSKIGPVFISLTKRDGRIIKIRRTTILGIEEMRREDVV